MLLRSRPSHDAKFKVLTRARVGRSKSFIRPYMKTDRDVKQANLHVAHFAQRDQLGIPAKHLTQRIVLF